MITGHLLVALVALVINSPDAIKALRTGAPTLACISLRPMHGFHRAKPAFSAPFTLSQSALEYVPHTNISVTLSTNSGSPDAYFRGFIVQAYDPITGSQIGHFEPTNDSKPVNSCSSATHRNNLNKQSVTLIWSSERATRRRTPIQIPRPYINIGTRTRRWWAPESSASTTVAPASAGVVTTLAPAANVPNTDSSRNENDNDDDDNNDSNAAHRRPSTGQVRFRASVVVTFEEFYTGFDSNDRFSSTPTPERLSN